MADKHDQDSSSETESDSGDRNDVKMQEMPLKRNLQNFLGGHTPRPPKSLARAFSTKKYSLQLYFPSKGVGISASGDYHC